MIRGLRITIRGDELSLKIYERIRTYEATISALDVRIKQREGGQPFDIRSEDGFKTLGELEKERQHYRDRVLCLTLLRENVVAEEAYVLDRTDLRLAELISSDFGTGSEASDVDSGDGGKEVAIDGLKLRMSGHEVRKLFYPRSRDA
jgi:hypothetical protein